MGVREKIRSDFSKPFKEKVVERMEKADKKIGNIAAYTAVSLSRAPHRVKATRPAKITENLNSTNFRAYPLKLYYPNPNGGGYIDSGMTMEEYLKKIKGGYVARGSGRFAASRFKYHEARKYRSPDFRMTPGSSYAVRGGSTRVTERTNRTYLKGTAKFSAEESAKVREYKRKEASILAKLRSDDAKKTSKKWDKYLESLRKLKEKEAAAKRITSKKKASFEKKKAAARQKYEDFVTKIQAKRNATFQKWKDRNIRYRIVAPLRGDTLDPQAGGLLRKGSQPGTPPKTWAGSGITNYYIGQRENGTDKMTGKKKWVNNYLVEKQGDLSYTVTLKPLKGSGDGTLYRLEYGGSQFMQPLLIGYIVTSRDKGGHRRVSFRKVKGKSKSVETAARPWISPTVERVRQRYNATSGNGKDTNGNPRIQWGSDD